MEQKFISDCRYRVIESSSLFSISFIDVYSHSYIFFLLLVSVCCIIRECGSTLTNFCLTYLLNGLQEVPYDDLPVQRIKFEVYHHFSVLILL